VRLLGLVKDSDCIVTPRRSCVIGGIHAKVVEVCKSSKGLVAEDFLANANCMGEIMT